MSQQFGSQGYGDPQDQYGGIPTTGQLPVGASMGPPPTIPRGLMPPTQGRPLSPPATGYNSMPGQQAYASPTSSMNFGVQQSAPPMTGMGRMMTPPGSQMQQVGMYGGSSTNLNSQTGVRSLGPDRIMQAQGGGGGTPPREAPAPPVMFQTAPVQQMQAQESLVDIHQEQAQQGQVGQDEENEYLHSKVQELEQSRREMEQQLTQYRNNPPPQSQSQHAMPGEDVATLQRRLRVAQDSEANAVRAHEARLHEIHELEEQIFRMRDEQGSTGLVGQGSNEYLLDLQRQLGAAKAAEATARRMLDDQSVQLEEQAIVIHRTRTVEAQHQEQHALNHEEKLALEQKFASVQREKDAHKKAAEDKHNQLQELQAKQGQDTQTLARKIAELTATEDSYQRQLVEDRRQIAELQDQLDSESRAKESHQTQNAANASNVQSLEKEVAYLRTVETFHKGQCDLHRKETMRLKRIHDEDAPPAFVPRMPLKALEERLMHLAVFMMIGLCSLPVMGAIAVLSDENYIFWMGRTWPMLIIGGCVLVFVLFIATMQGLLNWALPEHRSQFTMAFTWATFAALLGVILVPIALMANKEATTIASVVSQGCLTAMPQSELLVDYSQVLYNIRLSPACANATSVVECQGWAANKYTMYMQYLESDFHCGPLCPESPPPARAVHAPHLHNKGFPTVKPDLPSPPMFGPPVQNALGHAFLQTGEAVGQQVQLHKHRELPPSAGIMETALPHMQAKKLFSKGDTRMSCYPLIATRIQVLTTTFGGLWFYEGMGLMIISLLTSLYAGMYFALGLSKAE